MKKVLLVGCGHMGSALLTSWLDSKKYHITIIDPLKYKILKKKFSNKKIKLINNFSMLDKSANYNFVIFATKPIDLNKALVNFSSINLDKKTNIISVVAGKKIEIFEKNFDNVNNFYRVMPNMPALIGESMNCIVSSKKANLVNNKEVGKLFSYSGKTIFLENEDQIDMSTAISGSGPGFVFNLIDAMEKGAIKLGFDSKTAKILVTQTFKGSINLLIKNNMTAQELVKTVATKGGTTEAGLKVMNTRKLHQTFTELVKASYKKAKKQGKS